MNRDLSIALFISVLFLLVFSVIPFNWHQVGDFNFHYQRAANECPEEYGQESCDAYYPLLHLVGGIFSFSQAAFANYLMIILLFITPLILFFTTKKWMTVWLYFTATQYVYLIQAGGAYPQALAGIFLILFLWQKNSLIRFVLLVITLVVHSQAFVLLLIVWLVQLFFENVGSFKNMFPACSAIFGRQPEDPIGQTILIQAVNKNGIIPISVIVKDIVNFFVRTFPFPFLLAAFWQLKKEKDWALIVLVVVGFYYGIAAGQARIFLIIPLMLIPPLTRFYYNLNKKWRKWFFVLTLITFVINFGTWGLYKVQCLA